MSAIPEAHQHLEVDRMYCGDAPHLLERVEPGSVHLSFWSPPYFVGKSYEKHLSFDDWVALLSTVVGHHSKVLAPGGFLVINIADILCFRDPQMPRIQANVLSARRSRVTRADVLAVLRRHPGMDRFQIAKIIGCSEQTVQRRLENNNVRGGKYATQTKVKIVGGLVQKWGELAGLYLYDRRIWAKDPAWENCRWHSTSYRSVDEFEYLYVFWKPGITTVDRKRLNPQEWTEWGSRAVWQIRSVRANEDHEAKFPIELARRVIRLYSSQGDLVLDPFVGSGTTAVAAIQEKRHYLGFDVMPEYVRLATRNCRRALQPRSLQLDLTPA
jgi:site-specific DNA-methyltransferase (adenine-specific)